MTQGDVVIALLPQADGQLKHRPAVLLRKLPPFGDYLVCGVSSQLHLAVKDFDEVLDPSQPDYITSGLKIASVIRLGFLGTLAPSSITGRIGKISSDRYLRLLTRLSDYLRPGGPTLTSRP